MLHIAFRPTNIGAVRFAISPLEEVVQALYAVHDGIAPPWARGWLAGARAAVAEAKINDLASLAVRSAYTPDFLTPIPTGSSITIDEQLTLLAETPLELVEQELERAVVTNPELSRQVTRADLFNVLGMLTAQMERAWRSLISPIWSRVRDVLETDLVHRGRIVMSAGLNDTLNGIHKSLAWEYPLMVVESSAVGQRALDASGMVLIPSAFATSIGVAHPAVTTCAVIYPSRGTSLLRTAPVATEERPLGRIVGRTRGRVLECLTNPMTTTSLARALKIAPSTASGHLHALRHQGLVVGRLSGGHVLYERTDVGSALLEVLR